MKNFVISLSTAHDRREHIVNEFGQYNIVFEFFDAVTPINLASTAENFNVNLDNSSLTNNEKSCFMSHFSLWVKAVEQKLDYIAIFEDDIYLSDSAEVFLSDHKWLNVDVLKIEKTVQNVLMRRKTQMSFRGEKFILGELENAHMGAGGYILSLKAAKKLVNFVRSLDYIDHVDQVIFSQYKQDQAHIIFQMTPVLCVQDCILYPNNQKFVSSLQWRENKVKQQLNFFQKVQREILRFFAQIRNFKYKTKLEFYKKHKNNSIKREG